MRTGPGIYLFPVVSNHIKGSPEFRCFKDNPAVSVRDFLTVIGIHAQEFRKECRRQQLPDSEMKGVPQVHLKVELPEPAVAGKPAFSQRQSAVAPEPGKILRQYNSSFKLKRTRRGNLFLALFLKIKIKGNLSEDLFRCNY